MISFHLNFWRFVGVRVKHHQTSRCAPSRTQLTPPPPCQVWALFSASIGYLLYLCTRQPLDPTTPRNVFSWFLICHKGCIGVGAVGYALLLGEVLGLAPLVWLLLGKGASVLLLWYGLYFGVLGRDCAELVSDRMVRVGVGMWWGRK